MHNVASKWIPLNKELIITVRSRLTELISRFKEFRFSQETLIGV